MSINRPAVKEQAKAVIIGSKPSVITVGLVFLLFSIVVAVLTSRLVGVTLTVDEMQRYFNLVLEENFDAATDIITQKQPSFGAYLIDLALQIMLAVVSAGFTIFLLNSVRKTGPCFGNLLDGFEIFWRVIALRVLEWIIITLSLLLLIVPGIIMAYSMRQAIYLLIDHPELSPMQCIQKSRALMRGHKAELFVFDLSFIGWWLLSAIPVVGYFVQVWTKPYIGTSMTLYYEALRGSVQPASDSVPPFEG